MKNNILKYVILFTTYLFAFIFIAAGSAKIYGVPMLVAEFDVIGFGTWFRYFVGFWEITAGVLTLMPSKRHYGAILMVLASFGAFIAQVFFIHQDFIHTLVFIVLTGVVLYANRSKFI